MKRHIAILLMVAVQILFVGCDIRKHTDDYIEIYHDFLEYSLGDYSVVGKSAEKNFPKMGGKPVVYTAWSLQYSRYDGEARIFGFNNLGNRNNTENMGEAVVWAAGSIWIERIERDVMGRYFPPETMDPFARFSDDEEWVADPYIATTLTRLEIMPRLQRKSGAASYSDILNPQSGLRLRSITLPELQADWDIAYKVSVSTIDADNCFGILDQYKDMIRELSEYTCHERIELDFRASDKNGMISGMSFFGYYEKQADEFNVTYRK